MTYFNPHEREARDKRNNKFNQIGVYFNPHEREARDKSCAKNSDRGRRF